MNPYMTYLSEVKKAYIRAGVSLPYTISDRSASSDEVALDLSQAQAVLEGFGFLQDVLSVCNSAYCTHIDGMSGEMLYKDRLRELFLPEFKDRVAAEQMAQLEDLPKPLESISQGSQIPILGVFGKLDPDTFLVDSESKSTQTPEQRTQIIDYFSSVLSSTSDNAENSVGLAISSEEEVLSSDLDDIDDELEDFEELEMQELADLEDDVWNEDDTLTEPLDSVENLSIDETVSDIIGDDFFDNAEPASYEAKYITTDSAINSFDEVDDDDADEEEFNSFDDVDDDDADEEEFNSFDEVDDVDDDDADEEEFNSFDEVDDDDADDDADEDTGENNWNLFAEDDEGMSVENINDEEDEFVFSSDDEDDETMELFADFDSVTDEDTFDDVVDDSEEVDFDSVEDSDIYDEDDFDSIEDDSEEVDFDSVEDDSEEEVDFDSVEDDSEEEVDFDSVEDSDIFDDVVDDSEEGDFDEFDNVVEDEVSSDDSDSEFSLFDNLEDEGEDWGEVDVSAEDTSVDDAEFEEDDDSWGEELDNAISEALGSLMPDEEDDYFVFSEDDEDDEISSTEPDLNVTNQIPAEPGNTKQDFDEVLADALERGVSNLFAWGKRKLRGSRDDDTSH